MKLDPVYSLLDRCLHWLALEPSAVRRLSFDLECQFALPDRSAKDAAQATKAIDPADGAVYVCGLARSGTTTLLRILDEIDIFRSLTYRDMPFVLAPNLWKLLTQHSQLKAVAAERAHGDGVYIQFDSPEGFEEVFWRTFGSPQLGRQCLGMQEPTPKVLKTFSNYRALVANSRRQPCLPNGNLFRYLSKNNNNLLRLQTLSLDPTATILLVYRNPVDTARSLHRQHQSFCAAQSRDPFTRRYMTWLGHHEFGLEHLPFCFAREAMDAALDPTNVNYWLDYWCAVHQHILGQTDVKFYLVNHDAMRAYPRATLAAIFAATGVSADAAALAQHIAAPTASGATADLNPQLLARALASHSELLASSKNLSLFTDTLELAS